MDATAGGSEPVHIMGAGLSGLAAATILAKAGKEVHVHDIRADSGARPDRFFEEVDFLSIGGNDLKQFFFAADRENERVRRRYDTLNVSFLTFLENIVKRCEATDTPLSFCGEDAGRPVEAVCLAAIGLRNLSMRAASIGPVKHLLLRTDLTAVKAVIDAWRARGDQSVRAAVLAHLNS